jgi:hypothetical protein
MTVYPRITLPAGGRIHRGEADEALSLVPSTVCEGFFS